MSTQNLTIVGGAFRVSGARTYHVTVTWSVRWTFVENSSYSGGNCTVVFFEVPWVGASLFDSSSGSSYTLKTTLGTGYPSPSYANFTGSGQNYTGYYHQTLAVQVTFTGSVGLTPGHAYHFEPWVEAFAGVATSYGNGCWAKVALDMATNGNGATIVSESVK
jgi:hypothetical protein